jgi:hypothetical protein
VSRWRAVRHITPFNQQTSGSELFRRGFIGFSRVAGEAPIIVDAAIGMATPWSFGSPTGFLLEVEKLWLTDNAAFIPLVQEWRQLITG